MLARDQASSRLVHTTTTPNPLAAELARREPKTYIVCNHCRYEKVAGQPCGEPCV